MAYLETVLENSFFENLFQKQVVFQNKYKVSSGVFYKVVQITTENMKILRIFALYISAHYLHEE